MVIGSSNLTAGGLKGNIEVNAIIKSDVDNEIISDIYGLYNRLKFRSKLFKPDADYLENYERIRKTLNKSYKKHRQEPQNIEMLAELKQREKVLAQEKKRLKNF